MMLIIKMIIVIAVLIIIIAVNLPTFQELPLILIFFLFLCELCTKLEILLPAILLPYILMKQNQRKGSNIEQEQYSILEKRWMINLESPTKYSNLRDNILKMFSTFCMLKLINLKVSLHKICEDSGFH